MFDLNILFNDLIQVLNNKNFEAFNNDRLERHKFLIVFWKIANIYFISKLDTIFLFYHDFIYFIFINSFIFTLYIYH